MNSTNFKSDQHVIISQEWFFKTNITEYVPDNWKNWIKQSKKLSLYFNWAPRHEDVLGEWRYGSTNSSPRH
jgi:hypothetical protein